MNASLALAYAGIYGWSVGPGLASAKEPDGYLIRRTRGQGSWKTLAERPAGEDEIRYWFGQKPDANVLVLCGDASQGLAVLDFDRIAKVPPEGVSLPLTPTVQTGKGLQLYCADSTGGRSYEFDEGEVRRNGNYVVAPPSRHPNGRTYGWRPADSYARRWLEQARVVFLVVYQLGLRRGEVLGRRWKNIDLTDPEKGPTLRVEETLVWSRTETPKSKGSARILRVPQKLAGELMDHRGRTRYSANEERVFCHCDKGSALDDNEFAKSFRKALAKAKIEGHVRPFHDGRHSAITTWAATASNPVGVQARAGHSSFSTTQLYVHVAGELFTDDVDRAEERLLGSPGKALAKPVSKFSRRGPG